MAVDVDTPSQRLRYARWLLVPLALAVIALGIVLRVGSESGSASGGLRAQLADRVTAILEQSSTAEHHEHGHQLPGKGAVVCAVDVFGYEPADPAEADGVTSVYAHHLCAVTGTSGVWNRSVRASGPLAVRLSDPPVVRVVQPGAGSAERIRTMIPQPYQERALGRFSDQSALTEARRRFEAASTAGR